MPSLETMDGKPVDAAPPDAEAVNRQFEQVMNDDGPDGQAPPKRAPKPPAEEKPKRRVTRQPKAERARTTTAAAPAALSADQRADGVRGWAQIGAGLCMMAGKATGRDAFQADAVALASAADQLADACVQVAAADAAFAARLDRVCSVGPYGALIAVGVGVASQIARNHGVPVPGTRDPSELLAAQAGAEAEAAAAA